MASSWEQSAPPSEDLLIPFISIHLIPMPNQRRTDSSSVKGTPLQIQNGISSSESSCPSDGPPAAGTLLSEGSEKSSSLVGVLLAADACVPETLWSISEMVPTNGDRLTALAAAERRMSKFSATTILYLRRLKLRKISFAFGVRLPRAISAGCK